MGIWNEVTSLASDAELNECRAPDGAAGKYVDENELRSANRALTRAEAQVQDHRERRAEEQARERQREQASQDGRARERDERQRAYEALETQERLRVERSRVDHELMAVLDPEDYMYDEDYRAAIAARKAIPLQSRVLG